MAACERWRAAGLQRILSKLANMLEIQLPQGYWQHAVCFAALACAADGRWLVWRGDDASLCASVWWHPLPEGLFF